MSITNDKVNGKSPSPSGVIVYSVRLYVRIYFGIILV